MSLELRGKVSLDSSAWDSGISRLESTGKHAFSSLTEYASAAFGVHASDRMFHRSVETAKPRGLARQAQRAYSYCAKLRKKRELNWAQSQLLSRRSMWPAPKP